MFNLMRHNISLQTAFDHLPEAYFIVFDYKPQNALCLPRCPTVGSVVSVALIS